MDGDRDALRTEDREVALLSRELEPTSVVPGYLATRYRAPFIGGVFEGRERLGDETPCFYQLLGARLELVRVLRNEALPRRLILQGPQVLSASDGVVTPGVLWIWDRIRRQQRSQSPRCERPGRF